MRLPSDNLRMWIAALATFFAICAAAVVYFLGLAGFSPFGNPGYQLKAVVPSTIALSTGADVRIAGVRVGRVNKISLSADSAIIDMTIEPEDAPIYDNAEVYIGLKSQVGEAYVDLRPGGPPGNGIASGGTLPISRSPESTQLDQILDIFDRQRRRDIARTLDALGNGLAGEGSNLNTAFDAGSTSATHASNVLGALSQQRGQVASLVDDFGALSAALGDRASDIRLLTQRARTTAEVIAGRDQELRATLQRLPDVLAQTRSTTGTLESFSRSSTPVLRDLRLASNSLVPAVKRLEPAAKSGRRLVTALGDFAKPGKPLARDLDTFSRAADPTMEPLGATLRQLNPLLEFIRPYHREVGAVVGTARAALEPQDLIGHYIRVAVVYGRNTVAPLLTDQENAAVDTLTKSGLLSALVGNYGFNPYPKPGTADKPKPLKRKVPVLKPDAPYTAR